jgi:amino acid transporter
MTLTGLILMIFTSVFGFANSPSAFYLMGYSATPFYIVSALFFFIPFALMMAEMGSAYRKEEGGIYSWMNNSVGPRYAFIGTFILLRCLDGQHGSESLGTLFHIFVRGR